jgi:hypothetical protein
MLVSEEEAYHHHIHQIEQREDKDEEDAGEDDPADSRILQRTEHQDRLVFETADLARYPVDTFLLRFEREANER